MSPLRTTIQERFRELCNAKCVLAWKDIETKTCLTLDEAAKKNGLTRNQLNRWISMHHAGDIGSLRARLGLPRRVTNKL